MVLSRQHRVDQHSRGLVDADGLVLFTRAVRRAREHFGLERDTGDVLAPSRDLRDSIVDDLQSDEPSATSADFVAPAKIDVPVSPGTPEESGRGRSRARLRVSETGEGGRQPDVLDVNARSERLSRGVDERRATGVGALESADRLGLHRAAD